MARKAVENFKASAMALIAGACLAACQPADTGAPAQGAEPAATGSQSTSATTPDTAPAPVSATGDSPVSTEGEADHDHDHDHDHAEGEAGEKGVERTGEAHVHGAAEMVISAEAPGLVINFSSAMYNLAGFERAPKSEDEWKALQDVGVMLAAPGPDLVGINTEAGCVFTNAATVFKDADGVSTDTLTRTGAAHDADITWTYTCASPAALRSVKVGLFEAFPRLESIQTVTYGPAGERSAVLTPQALTATFAQ
jgi:hypothetical protein